MPIFAHMSDFISTNPVMSTIPTLGAFSPMATNLLIGGFLVVSIVMILLVLIQRPQGGGLSGAFGAGGSGGGGGGGAGQTAFGTKTGDVLTWATIGIFLCFLTFAIVLNFATRPQKASFAEPVINPPAGAVAPAELPTDSPIDSLGEATEDAASETQDVIEEGQPADIPAELPTDLPTDLPTGDE